MGMDNDAMYTILRYISELQSGKLAEIFGYVLNGNDYQLTTMSKRAPKIHLALQFLIRNFFRINNVVTIRLGKGVQRTNKCNYCDGSTLIYYHSDNGSQFK